MTSITREYPHFSDDELRAIARTVEPHDHERIAPPAQVWDNILAEVEVETASSEASARRQASRQWFGRTQILSVAAAALVVVALMTALTVRNTSDDPVELAVASLTDDGLPESTPATAQARFVCTGDQCSIDVDLSAVPDAGNADLELWVINSDVSDMHSLGLITTSGLFELPEGVTSDGFPIVDISIEPRDGDVKHSGRSVLRGVLEEV